MIKLTSQVYKRAETLATNVVKNLRAKGLVIPVEEDDGSISFENYSVVKHNGYYSVINSSKIPLFDKIYLAQTAVILANDLALGKWHTFGIVEYDRLYGQNSFEVRYYDRLSKSLSKRKEWDKLDIVKDKQLKAESKAEHAKKTILRQFEKLQQIR